MVPLESLGFLFELQSPVPTGHGAENEVFYCSMKPSKMSIVAYIIMT